MIFKSKFIYTTIFTLIVCGIITGCGESIEDPEPPLTPRWVEKSAPEDTLERGIDAYESGDGIFLEWYQNPDEDISGYKIYRADVSPDNDFKLLVDVNAFGIGGEDTSFTDNSVNFNVDYFYFLKAYDQAGNKSPRSDTIRYGIVEKVGLNYPSGEISDINPVFEWQDFYHYSSNEYLIRVEKIYPKEVIWISRMSPPNYGDYLQSISFNNDGMAQQNELTDGVSYKWRVDIIAGEYYIERDSLWIEISGSESYWGYFSIKQ